MDENFFGTPAARILEEILDDAFLEMIDNDYEDDDDDDEENESEDHGMEIDEQVLYEDIINQPTSLYRLAIRKYNENPRDKPYLKTILSLRLPTKAIGDILDEARESCHLLREHVMLPHVKENAFSVFTRYCHGFLTERLIFQKLLKEYDRCKLHRIVQEFFNVFLECKMLLHNSTTKIQSHTIIDRVDVLIANSVIMSSVEPSRELKKDLTHNFTPDFKKYCADVAEFLTEAGWFKQAAILFDFIRERYPGSIKETSRLIYCNVMDGEIQKAKELLSSNENVIADVQQSVQVEFLTAAALVYYAEGNFQKALRFSIRAFSRVKGSEISKRAYIETLRCLSRCLAVTRNYAKALVFSELCLHTSAQFEHKLADGLLTHAYCLMQDDRNNAANKFYLKAKDLREKQFGTSNNVHLATVYEELSYSCYVQKYRVGDFRVAKHFISRAMRIYNRILREDHLHASSAKRVLALIIEEEALDIPFQPVGIEDKILNEMKDEALEEAHLLQQESLAIAKKTFGDQSVQTAKHLGNLGRLYQSMKRLKDAEELHLEAIRIKSCILGDDDPEVAVSLGHLASLYNYDIKDYHKAEDLYHRGIKICLKHHGDLYSGLEYDYTGLINVYSNLKNERKHLEYTFILSDWKDKRKERVQRAFTPKLDPDMKIDSLLEMLNSISAEFKL